MSKFEELLDSIFVIALRFPVTFTRLLLNQREAFAAESNCSPGAFLAVALLTSYISLQVLAAVTNEQLPKWFDKDLALIVAIGYVSLLVNVQRSTIGRLFSIRQTVDAKAKFLLYPASMLLIFLALITPIQGSRTESLWWTDYAISVFHLIYFWVTFVVCRHAFELSRWRALFAAVTAHISFMLIPVGAYFLMLYST